jgi:hypothetical protein
MLRRAVLAMPAAFLVSSAALLGCGTQRTNPGASASSAATIPAQTMAVTPAPTDGTDLPAKLVGTWFGASKAMPGLASGSGSVLLLDVSSFRIVSPSHQDEPLLGGRAAVADSRLVVRAEGPANGPCDANLVGMYAFELSASGETLTVTTSADPCAERAAALPDVWRRADCRLVPPTCLGVLDAGVYGSQYVRPVLGGKAWAPAYGGLTFDVPAGWANHADWPFSYGLSLAADYEAMSGDQTEPDTKLTVLTQVQAPSTSTPCGGQPDPAIPSRTRDIERFLRSVPGLGVAPHSPLRITVTGDGWTGIRLGLRLNASEAHGCGGEPIIEYLIAGGHEGYGIAAGEAQTLILVDVGTDEVVAIRIEAPDDEALRVFTEAAMPIIETFRFK